MRKLLILLIAIAAQAATITGTFQNADGSVVNGFLTVQLTQGPVLDSCNSNQKVTFQVIRVAISNGVLGSLSLPATSCLSPVQKYKVSVFDSTSKLLYNASWTVPVGSTVDVTTL